MEKLLHLTRYIGRLIGNRHGAGTGPVWLNGVRCAGTEYGIDRCHHSDFGLHNRSHNQDVSIACNYKGRPTQRILV